MNKLHLKLTILTVCYTSLTGWQLVTAQPAPASSRATITTQPAPSSTDGEKLFDLDFPGGGPKEFVKAIEAASGEPFNAVISEDAAGIKIPAVKLKGVALSQILMAMSGASISNEQILLGTGLNGQKSYTTVSVGYDWRPQGKGPNCVWYLSYRKPPGPSPTPPPVCRYYQLGPYLSNHKIEDITTAIKIGWDLLGEKEQPTMKFHPETKLLIAVGMDYQLETIAAVLRSLEPGSPHPGMIDPRPSPSPATELQTK